MTPGQTSLALYTCRECGVELEYQGVGRPPAFCAAHRPASFPPLKNPVRSRQQLNGGLSVQPTARLTDPETSHAAAEKVAPSAATCRTKALLALVDHGPMHDFDLAKRTGVKQTSIGVRRKELVSQGLVERAPVKPRPNDDGNLAQPELAAERGFLKAGWEK